MTHVNSLKMESESAAPGEKPQFLGVREQRVTHITIFVLCGLSIFFTAYLKHIPMPGNWKLICRLSITVSRLVFCEQCEQCSHQKIDPRKFIWFSISSSNADSSSHSSIRRVPVHGHKFAGGLAILQPSDDCVYATEVPTRLHVPTSRAHLPSAHLHVRSAQLLRTVVDNQIQQANLDHLPGHAGRDHRGAQVA